MTRTLQHSIAAVTLIAAMLAPAHLATAAPASAIGTPATPASVQPDSARPSNPFDRDLRSDAQRYAARERATPALAEFRGGDTIVIGASAVAVVLAIVLILVLI